MEKRIVNGEEGKGWGEERRKRKGMMGVCVMSE